MVDMNRGMSASPSCLHPFRALSPPCVAVFQRRRRTPPRAAPPISPIEDERENDADAEVNQNSPDSVLVRAACAGDPRAPGIIWRRYGGRVRGKLLRWMGPHDLDDHSQDVFVRLFEQLPRLRDVGALHGFLIGITLRIACGELRRRRRSRMRLTTTGDLPEPPATIEDDGPAREALWRFESIVAQLAPSSKRVFVLRYVEKLELTDVAAAMSISVATAKRHLARAAVTVAAMVRREPALAAYLPAECADASARVFSATV